MSSYDNWQINGITPSWIVTSDKDPVNRRITLHCAAIYDKIGNDPRTEIKTFQDLSCTQINNTDLLNGGTKLQVQGGSTVTLVEKDTLIGDISYTAALEGVDVKEDSFSDDMIEYDLIFHYELSGGAKYAVYVPNYHSYTNIDIYGWYYLVDGVWTKVKEDQALFWSGTEFGWMQIVETKQVKKIEVYGSACLLPASLTVEGSIEGTQNWNYHHDVYPSGSTPSNDPFQKLVFNFAEGSYPTILTLHTTEHHNVAVTPSLNHGCWLKWIKVYYA